MITFLMRECAKQLLAGDEVAFSALMDQYLENKSDGLIYLPPIRKIECPPERISAILYPMESLGADIEVDAHTLEIEFLDWIHGERKTLPLIGFNRIELYELPESKFKRVIR